MLQHVLSHFSDARLGALVTVGMALKDVRTSDITLDHLEMLGEALGVRINVSEDLKEAIVGALREDDIDKLGDLLSRPELFEKLAPLLLASEVPEVRTIIRNCKHCGALNEYTVQPT